MITATTSKDGNQVQVNFNGTAEEITSELNRVIARGAEVLARELNGSYTGAFYATVMSAADIAREFGLDLDVKKVGLAMMLNGKSADQN